jgi:hypothetical protein
MDAQIFKKMKVKPPCTAMVLHPPPDYPKDEDITWQDTGQVDFVHLFAESKNQFAERFPKAITACKDPSLLWVSYPKLKGKKIHDINRDSLWRLLLDAGYHPVSQIALDDDWSAVRVKPNEAGVDYTPPKNVKQ